MFIPSFFLGDFFGLLINDFKGNLNEFEWLPEIWLLKLRKLSKMIRSGCFTNKELQWSKNRSNFFIFYFASHDKLQIASKRNTSTAWSLAEFNPLYINKSILFSNIDWHIPDYTLSWWTFVGYKKRPLDAYWRVGK